ncbi:UvrD-helicase domain-containing protein [Desulfuromonas sp. AOP6]|uniref:UvrD-helicase domain-containing protein n=1 Tax=Desulfuromonas sp. AOP6 TaxID=1566351 RepID=UPI001287C657|nr:UvrD-helicase domain-containing protein [Desulfuromonas sp. AOP6]BCA79779.1 ATP-dependent helicase [Desulfuromonas sp. AOP6]
MNQIPAPILSDALQREQGVDPRRSFIVQAPAGSGKTELLIQRFLALLATVNRPEDILAITFTRKAAGEMRHRLLEALGEAGDPRPEKPHAARTWELARQALERDCALGWNILANPSRLTIQTIDSFNASLVRHMPWLSRLGGMPDIADDPVPLYRRACQKVLARLQDDQRGSEAVQDLLAHLDNRMDTLQDLLVSMLPRRDQWLRHVVKGNPQRERAELEQALSHLIQKYLSQLAETIPEALRAVLLEGVRFAAENLANDNDRPLGTLRNITDFPGDDPTELPAWKGLADLLLTAKGDFRRALNVTVGFPPGHGSSKEMKKALSEAIAELDAIPGLAEQLKMVSMLPPAVYSEKDWQTLSALIDVLVLAAAELWLVFGQENQADYSEIALKALDALQEGGQPSELLLKLDSRIQHILVDEFQDTSFQQYSLLEALTEGWTPGDGRTLFVVGDPMQSIYRFREAEVGLFLKVRHNGLAGVPLESLNLCTNFRSQENIVHWINASFSTLFPCREDETKGAVTYSMANPIHPPLPGRAVTFHPLVGKDALKEASLVVQIVQEVQIDNPTESLAILVRSRSHLPSILLGLRKAGINYQAHEIDSLQQRAVALDILSLTRALLHPGDRLAWLAVLRAPWCGLALADLHVLSHAGVQKTILEQVQDPETLKLLSEDAQKRLHRIGPLLARGLRYKGRIDLRQLVESSWMALGGPACVDATDLADADTVFALLDQHDAGGDIESFEALEESLSKLFAAADASSGIGLQVMTIHKAKGLEFDTVIIPGLGHPPRHNNKPLLRWLESPEWGLLLAPVEPTGSKGKNPLFDLLGRLELDKADQEVIRLLYVAATRAKNRLHLVGHAQCNQEDTFTPASGSLLQKLWPVVEKVFAGISQHSVLSHKATSVIERDWPIRRLPAAWESPHFSASYFTSDSLVHTPSARGDEVSLFSGWEAETARHVGTVTHAYLDVFAREGLSSWTGDRLEKRRNAITKELNALGVPLDEAVKGTENVLRALRVALTSDRGRWVLADYEQTETEVPLSGVIDGRQVQAVIDRSFVDAQGIRWIIDYKVTEDTAMKPDQFMKKEAEKYKHQLATYVRLWSNLEPLRQVRSALYFPLFNGWWELQG